MRITQKFDSLAAELVEEVEVTISNSDFLRIQELAIQEDLPYQTFLEDIIHKVSTGQKVHFAQDEH